MSLYAEIKDENGKLVGIMTVAPKNFSTGSKGYYASGKLEVNGKRHQVAVSLVEIGSKPKAGSEPAQS